MAESDPRADAIEWTKPILLLAGPTASGKSRLALELARRRDAVILNADSQQLYADLRVLTARPSVEDEALAEHRLYGFADAADAWSVGRWLRTIDSELSDVARSGRFALVVGGTGLYFAALTRGLADIPPIPSTVRDQARTLYDRGGEIAFRRRLAEIDPDSAERIGQSDRQRLMRAWAVAHVTGRAIGDWRATTRPRLSTDDFDAVIIEPERQNLYAACDRRVTAMVERGAVDEVRALLDRRLPSSLPAMRAVGVPELTDHLAGHSSLAEALARIAQGTRRYAKRQMTWFRNQTPDWRRIGA